MNFYLIRFHLWIMNPYLKLLDSINPHNHKQNGLKVLDLFAGCGGLGLGFEAAGFETIGIEMDQDASDSYNKNLLGDCINQKLSINI